MIFIGIVGGTNGIFGVLESEMEVERRDILEEDETKLGRERLPILSCRNLRFCFSWIIMNKEIVSDCLLHSGYIGRVALVTT